MTDFDRRDFIATAIGGIGLAGAASFLSPGHAFAAAGPQYLRRNIYCLNNSSKDLVAYKKGIQVMQTRPATDPTSWLAQANIHGAFTPIAGMIANACQHHNQFFLSWHRMYLYFFEQIVRKASGDSTFALPYWGYSPTGARNLPAPFRDPAEASNPLYVSQRAASVNAGASLSASSVDSGNALAEILWGDFASSLEFTPHDVTHGNVGGGGWMSYFETAGQDPIFWLHHANIDRLWAVWLAMGGGRVNPTSNTVWMTTKFDFYNENGQKVSMTGADVLDTALQLNHKYAATSCIGILRFHPALIKTFTLVPTPIPRIIESLQSIRTRPPRPEPLEVALATSPVRLSASPAKVRMTVSGEARRTLEAFPTDPTAGNRLALLLEDIRLELPPTVYYEIYVNLPGSAEADYKSPYFVGNLGFFGPSPQSRHTDAHSARRRVVGLLPVYIRLRTLNRWSNESIDLSFVPRGPTDRDVPSRVLGNRTQAVIGRLSIQVQ